MKFYIATTLSNHEQHNKLRDTLILTRDAEMTYDWTRHGSVQHESEQRISEVAALEAEGVLDADEVFVLLPGGRGTHAELGMAIASGKRIVMCGIDTEPLTCAFYHHPLVACWYDSLDELINAYTDV